MDVTRMSTVPPSSCETRSSRDGAVVIPAGMA